MAEPHTESGAPTNGVRAPLPVALAEGRAATIAALAETKPDAAEAAPEAAVEHTALPATQAAGAAPTAPDEKSDPDTDKRLAKVQAEHKRAKDSIAKERSDFEKQQTEWKPKLEAAEGFLNLRTRIAQGDRTALFEAMEALGITDEHYENHAKVLYASRKGADPKERAAVAGTLESREARGAADKAMREIESLKAELTKRDQAAQLEKLQTQYLADVTTTVETAEAPLLKTALTKSPAKTQAALMTTAQTLFDETGEWPEPADVVSRYESNRRAELAELGVELPPAKTKTQQPAADKKRPAQTLTTDLSTSTPVPRAAKSIEEQREETRRLLDAGKLE